MGWESSISIDFLHKTIGFSITFSFLFVLRFFMVLSTRLFDLNFFSYVALTKTVLPDMIKQGSGQLVVMSSLSGKIGTPVASTYR